MLGRELHERATGKAFVVESVRKAWYRGWFLTALISCDGSHGSFVIDAPACQDVDISRAFQAFKARLTTTH